MNIVVVVVFRLDRSFGNVHVKKFEVSEKFN